MSAKTRFLVAPVKGGPSKMEGESEKSKYNSYTLSLATVRASTNGAKNNGELPKVVGFQR